jgi:hypothetical protein
MSEIAFYYDETKNRRGAFITGVPLRDLTQKDIEALPERKVGSIQSAPFFIAAAVLEMDTALHGETAVDIDEEE